MFGRYITWVMILHGIEYQRPTSLNMRILADHVTYSFLAFMKSIFHFCLGCYCGGYSQNGSSNLSSSAYCKSARLLRNHYWTFGKTTISHASQIFGDLTVSCQSRYYYSRIWVCYCNHDIIKDVIIHPRHNINPGPKVRGHWHFCVTFLSESVNKNTIWYGILGDENFGLGQYMPQNLSVTHPLTLTGCTE